MADIFNLPNTDENFQIFYGNNGDWQMWNKPRNATFVSIIVSASGAGGGGGGAGSGVARTGSSGGGGGCLARGLFPAFMLPDILYVSVAVGGSGGTSNTQGGVGGTTFVSIAPNTTLANTVIASNAAVAVGGNPAGTASSSAQAFGLNTSPFANECFILSLGAANSAAGGANTGGAGGSIAPAHIIIPGAGGGGSSAANANGAGGGITAAGFFPGTSGGAAGGANAGTTGFSLEYPSKSSNIMRYPLFNYSGAGGGANGAATGGAGGDGSLGCGGGGGGAGTTGGAGGRGGDGFAIIVAW